MNARVNFTISPNPFVSTGTVTYNVQEEGVITIMVLDGTGNPTKLVITNEEKQVGEYSETINTSNLQPGYYTIVVLHNGEVIGKSALKL